MLAKVRWYTALDFTLLISCSVGDLDKRPIQEHSAPSRSSQFKLSVSLLVYAIYLILRSTLGVFRKSYCFCSSLFAHRNSIPFFFEPNFDAVIKPLAAALRLQEGTPKKKGQSEDDNRYEPVVYGNFLLGKVTNNFDSGKGKYD